MKLLALDLFHGGGGAALGMQWAGKRLYVKLFKNVD